MLACIVVSQGRNEHACTTVQPLWISHTGCMPFQQPGLPVCVLTNFENAIFERPIKFVTARTALLTISRQPAKRLSPFSLNFYN